MQKPTMSDSCVLPNQVLSFFHVYYKNSELMTTFFSQLVLSNQGVLFFFLRFFHYPKPLYCVPYLILLLSDENNLNLFKKGSVDWQFRTSAGLLEPTMFSSEGQYIHHNHSVLSYLLVIAISFLRLWNPRAEHFAILVLHFPSTSTFLVILVTWLSHLRQCPQLRINRDAFYPKPDAVWYYQYPPSFNALCDIILSNILLICLMH